VKEETKYLFSVFDCYMCAATNEQPVGLQGEVGDALDGRVIHRLARRAGRG
jgi:hypothetical protein